VWNFPLPCKCGNKIMRPEGCKKMTEPSNTNNIGYSSPANEFVQMDEKTYKPLVSLVIPALNEDAIVENHLNILIDYMSKLESKYNWEIIFIDDGSTDKTGDIAEKFAEKLTNFHVFHHITNFGLGQAFKFAFSECKGDYVITLDIDLSYSADHIERLLEKIETTKAKVVLASPYMEDGEISNVPFIRKTFSVWANRFLSLVAHGHLSTLTCMVRAYDGRFVRSLNLRSIGMEVMPEIIYKTMILRGRIEQIPAHLDWGMQNEAGPKRKSSMRVYKHIISTLLSGFIFRPFMFFILPGVLLLIFSLYTNFWAIMHFFSVYLTLPQSIGAEKISTALSTAYSQYPYTYIVGLLSLMLAVQLIGLGMQALQSKNYYEEIFHLTSRIYRLEKERDKQ